MKKSGLFIILLCLSHLTIFAQKESAYFEIGKVSANLSEVMESCKEALSSGGFNIIGEYSPAQSEELAVVCYTNPELEKIVLSFEDRGALAATLKVGFKKEGDLIKVSMLNPMYLF